MAGRQVDINVHQHLGLKQKTQVQTEHHQDFGTDWEESVALANYPFYPEITQESLEMWTWLVA